MLSRKVKLARAHPQSKNKKTPPSTRLLWKQLSSQGVRHLSHSLLTFTNILGKSVCLDLKDNRANTKAIDESKAEHKDEREVVEQRSAAIRAAEVVAALQPGCEEMERE